MILVGVANIRLIDTTLRAMRSTAYDHLLNSPIPLCLLALTGLESAWEDSMVENHSFIPNSC